MPPLLLSSFLSRQRLAAAFRRAGWRAVFDGLPVIALALILAAGFSAWRTGEEAQHVLGFLPRRIVFPFMPSLHYMMDVTRYLAWTDVAENVFHGLAIARGERLYDVNVIAHAPGVMQYLALFYWPLGFSHAIGSPETEFAAMLVGSFAALLFQVGCLWIALRLVDVPRAWSVPIVFIICGYTARRFDFGAPMSETLIPYAFVFIPILMYRILFAERADDRVATAVVLGGPITFLCVSLGLTGAPANAWIALVCFTVVASALITDRKGPLRVLTRDPRCLWAYTAVALIFAVHAMTIDLRNAYFWIFDINRRTNDILVTANLISSFGVHFGFFWHKSDPLGARYPDLLAYLAGLALLLWWRGSSDRRGFWIRFGLFCGILAVAAIGTQWRIVIGWKSATLFGLSLGVFCLLVSNLRLPRAAWMNAIFVPLFVLAALQFHFVQYSIAYSTERTPRLPGLDEANICRLGQTSSCRCLQSTVWTPEFFLEHDVRACPGRYQSYNPTIARDPMVHANLIADLHRDDTAFLVFPRDLMAYFGTPAEAMDYFRDRSACARIDWRTQVCWHRRG